MARRIAALLIATAFAFACGDDTAPTADADAASSTTAGTPTEGSVAAESDPPGGDGDTTTSTEAPPAPTLPWPAPLTDGTAEWTIRVIDRIPHDESAYTQGLEYGDGVLWESTGLQGESTLRTLDPETGEVLESTDLAPTHYGEGLTLVDGLPIQLTWRDEVLYRWADDGTSTLVDYDGEGWGICNTGDELWMSDGTSILTRRDPTTFAVTATVSVRRDGEPVGQLNELECIGDHVVANRWKFDEIVVIDPTDGAVRATIDAVALRLEVQPTNSEDVLNGIADRGDGTLLLGGKRWPTFFVVEVVEVG
ncbi:MAG: glutaminyl-peptide cyclotransferase [Actinomycetota bacterium]